MEMSWKSLYNYMVAVDLLTKALKRDIIKDGHLGIASIEYLNKTLIAANQLNDLLIILEKDNIKYN